jgi:hypothetical protein
MAYTNRFSEEVIPLAVHYPATRQVATHVSDWVLMSKYHRAFLYLAVGAMGGSSTVNAKLQQATSSAGAGAKDITGKAIEALTGAGSDGDSLAGIELQTEELDVNGGFKWVRFSVTVGVADVTYGATLFGLHGRYEPVPVTAYDEIVG